MKMLVVVVFMMLALPTYAQQPPAMQSQAIPVRIANGVSTSDELLDLASHLEKRDRLDPIDVRRARNLAIVAKETLAQAKAAYFSSSNDERLRATKMVEAAELTLSEAREILQERQRRP